MLDVAGGAGDPSLTIAKTVGPSGSVTCTDAVAEMVDAARSEATRQSIKNVQFRQCGPTLSHSQMILLMRLLAGWRDVLSRSACGDA